jgi:uracil-DNA glycosylase
MTDIWHGTSGPRTAPIMVVGEAWGYEEQIEGRPFVGQSGQELRRMLAEAGIQPESCFFTNVIPARPEGNEMWRFFEPAKGATLPPLRGLHPLPELRSALESLYAQIRTVQPKVVVACGNYALWALTNCTSFSTTQDSMGRRVPSGIMQWRGSQWWADVMGDPQPVPLVPLIHPAAILRAWYNRAVTVHDLRERVAKQALRGDWRAATPATTLAPPSHDEAVRHLKRWLERCQDGEQLRLVNDIETARGLMTCIGFADSPQFAMSVPFIRSRPGASFENFWSTADELTLIRAMRPLLSHPNCLVEGQNYLYDIQYIQKYLGVTPNHSFDSMLAHHLLFPGTPKGLDYLSSLYCHYHWYWKEDHKEWDMKGTIEDLLEYNALDCLRNFEINTELRSLIPKMGQSEQWKEEMEKNQLALEMMNRGIAIDTRRRAQLMMDLSVEAENLAYWFQSMIPQHVASPDAGPKVVPWWQSAAQQRRFFSEDLGLRLPINRKTGNETFGYDALVVLKEKHLELTRLFDNLIMFRSIKVFHNTFIKAELEPGNRMKCMFNTAGTETFRWSSSSNAFGRGTNLQNIPSGEED